MSSYIVDDDVDMLRLLSKWLVTDGFEVVTAQSGEEAFSKIAGTRPSLVITDLIMGGMNGIELMSRIHNINPLLPVILLSG